MSHILISHLIIAAQVDPIGSTKTVSRCDPYLVDRVAIVTCPKPTFIVISSAASWNSLAN
jgi:hypothetical protein